MNPNMPVDGNMNTREKSDVYSLTRRPIHGTDDHHRHDGDDVHFRHSRRRLTLTCLPDDVLLVISRYLDVQSLGRLCQACSRFRNLASSDAVWLPHSKNIFIIKDLKRNG